jgi:hypothetical protein
VVRRCVVRKCVVGRCVVGRREEESEKQKALEGKDEMLNKKVLPQGV